MSRTYFCFDNIEELSEEEITYMLYQEGKTIKQIAIIRRMNEKEVSEHLIKIKVKRPKSTNNTFIVELLSMVKNDRIKKLMSLNDEQIRELKIELYNDYTKYKNSEDRMILIWLIGEIRDIKFLPFLKMELRSKKVNHRRLACSALGKINDKKSKEWLEEMLRDENSQVRQYAIKALSNIADEKTYSLIYSIYKNESEKQYVKKTAKDVLEKLKII
ncbi:HEAT repeat domain-containing protein [Clostridiaceae bacterium M8S5]|nr:HEAT repeat domain-containing protein [Clostridiaceae bacterium M8S5]